jgi:hypothetical protein
MAGYGTTPLIITGGFKNPILTNNSLTGYEGDDKNNQFIPTCSEISGDKQRFQDYWTEFTRRFGVRLDYWKHGYDLEKHDFLYGENPTAAYEGPRILKGAFEAITASNIFSKFGIMGDNDGELHIAIDEWERVWGTQEFPTMKDVFRIKDSACDRPEGQTSWVYEVIDKYDHSKPVDFLGGHYVWRIPVKRFKYSYEPNAPDEKNGASTDVSDSDFFGRLTAPSTPDKKYDQNVDEESKKDFKTDGGNQYGNYV